MIRYFNPGHEIAVLNGSKFYMAPANVVNMQRDLAFLPAYYSSTGDFVFMDNKPSVEFIGFLNNELSLHVNVLSGKDLESTQNRPIGLQVDMWGVTPQAIHKFEILNEKYNLNLSLPKWHDAYRKLSDRRTSFLSLEYLLNTNPGYYRDILPCFFYSLDEIEEYLEKNDQTRYLLKAPFSSSGRGLLWLPLGKLTRTEKQIIHGYLKKQGYVSVERVLDKKIDFAMEFQCEDSKVNFVGFSLFQTNNKGAYVSNYIGMQSRIQNTLSEYIDLELLEQTKSILIDYLQNNIPDFYNGYIGIDMMIYHENGEYKLHPCVEINARCNMGIIAINISQRLIAENSEGYFYIDFNPRENILSELHKEMTQKHPLVLENKRIKSGYFSLCPVTEKTKYRAYLLINSPS